MYSTCLFCNEHLGANGVIEHFQVGRRLAFDATRGRLWVVCRTCERWNLTPLEERWEAIEECERLFSATRLRVSTDNIGLAKLREGLELVRIGHALRPEMAAWRYGDQFGRRRRRHLLLSGAAIAAVGGFLILGPATGLVAGGGWGSWQLINGLHGAYQNRRVRARVRMPDSEEVINIRKRHLDKVAVVHHEDDWAIRVPLPGTGQTTLFSGADALRAASRILPAINERGARPAEVQSAVEIITNVNDPAQLFRRYAPRPREVDVRRFPSRITAGGDGHEIASLPQEVRIALEMASHEEQERRAMEGELALLQAAWRDAEEIARIADDMFVPDSTARRLEELKRGV